MFHSSNLVLLFWSLLVFVAGAVAENDSGVYGSMEPAFVHQDYPRGLTEAELKAMSLDDPKLRVAYMFLIGAARGGPKIVDDRTPEMVAALNDLKRRGDAATPLLLDIMDKNRNTIFERLIPLVLTRVDSIKISPYIDYLRRMIQTRPMEINGSAFEVATELFLDYGTPDDIKMVKELAARRPYLAPSLQTAYEHQSWKIPAAQQSGNADPAKIISSPDDLKRVRSPKPSDKPNGNITSPSNISVAAETKVSKPALLLGGWPLWIGIVAAIAGIVGWLVVRSRCGKG